VSQALTLFTTPVVYLAFEYLRERFNVRPQTSVAKLATAET